MSIEALVLTSNYLKIKKELSKKAKQGNLEEKRKIKEKFKDLIVKEAQKNNLNVEVIQDKINVHSNEGTIEIEISKDGEKIHIDAYGFIGDSCEKAAQFLFNIFGSFETQKKAEYFLKRSPKVLLNKNYCG